MKTATNLTMSEMMNFDRDVVNYINDNREYIESAEDALDHYNRSAEAFGDTDEYLSEEQKERFMNVAKRLFANGFVEHAGVLSER